MKKGAYDLGRKALYYIVAIMIIAFIFVYVSNALYKQQGKGLENLNSIKGIGAINQVNSCFYYEDKELGRIYANTVDMEKFKQENLENCSEIPMRVTLTKLEKEPKQQITLTYQPENIKEGETLRRLVTIKDRGAEEEALLQVEIQK